MANWEETLKVVASAVVALKVNSTRSFDTESSTTGHATGFVVDKKLGLILTNRHVITPGPITAEALFLNHEEMSVTPVYRDPVHDYGFFHFDPSQLKFMQVEEIKLAPCAARVGLDVRVIGNDAGEKLSILPGTLARLDRDSPSYSTKGYNDFNTFYYQAASGTKGGSSGSPVINIDGEAVGLNSGAKKDSSSAFYLPLHRVLHVLDILRSRPESIPNWPTVSRGTMQASFLHKGFDELRRLGIQEATEQAVRAGHKTTDNHKVGMLVADVVVPKGPGEMSGLRVGDVIVKVDGKLITNFLQLESLLDDMVKQSVLVEVERGGTSHAFSVVVQSLHDISPDRYLEVSGACIHSLSYHQGRNFCIPVGKVYVASSGYAFSRGGISRHCVITALNGQSVETIDEFARVYASLEPGSKVPIRYFVPTHRHREKTALLPVDSFAWYPPMGISRRCDSTGLWEKEEETWQYPDIDKLRLSDGKCNDDNSTAHKPGQEGGEGAVAPLNDVGGDGNKSSGDAADIRTETSQIDVLPSSPVPEGPSQTENAIALGIANALVVVEFDIPHMVDGAYSSGYLGGGIIVDVEKGIVLVDRDTVPAPLGDVVISVPSIQLEMMGKVVFLHPVYNFSLLCFDPSKLKHTNLATPSFCGADGISQPVHRGEEVLLVGLTESHQMVTRRCTVIKTEPVDIKVAAPPRYRATNQEVVHLDVDVSNICEGGVLVNPSTGEVRAFWSSYSAEVEEQNEATFCGLPAELIWPSIEAVSGSYEPSTKLFHPPSVYSIEVELRPILLAKGRHLGLSDDWVSRLAKHDPVKRRVLTVNAILAGVKSSLQQGDMLLRMRPSKAGDSTYVTDFARLDEMCQKSGREWEQRRRVVTSNSDTKGEGNSGVDGAVDVKRKEEGGNEDGNKDNVEKKEEDKDKEEEEGDPNRPFLLFDICRSGKVMFDVPVYLTQLSGVETSRVVQWAGALLQNPHRAVRERGFLPKVADSSGGVYISRWYYGSPAQKYGLWATHWIVEMESQPVTNFEDFLRIASGFKNGQFVRIRTQDLHSKEKILSLKLDLHYWPTWELNREGQGWKLETKNDAMLGTPTSAPTE